MLALAGGDGARRSPTSRSEAVARRSESLLVSAAAGSGKTSVLVERFVRAVREDGVAPGRILAITFTERAAGELRERVRARLLELGDREAARDTEAAFVGTFHGFCARLLRAHPLQAGLDPGFTILDEGARRAAARAGVRGGRCASCSTASAPEAVDLLAAYGVDRVRAMIEQVYAGAAQPRPAPCRGCPSGRGSGADASDAATSDAARGLRCCSTSCSSASARPTSSSSASRAGCRLRRPRAARARLLDEREERARGLGRALRAADGRRVPGHQPAPAGDPARARPRQPVHGRRRAAVDLRLPPRRRQPVPRARAASSQSAARASR